MSVIQFETTIEDNLIRIPEQYIDQIPTRVSVTLVDVEKPRLKYKTRKELPSIDEFPAMLDTRGWKFDREEDTTLRLAAIDEFFLTIEASDEEVPEFERVHFKEIEI